MIFHNSNEEYPQPLSMFTQKEWDELGSGHLSSDTILDFFDLPPDKVAEYKEKGYVGVYAPYSLVSSIANKTLPGNHKQWFFLDNILNNMDIQATNRKRVDLLIKDEGYYIHRVELDFSFMPEKQISKVVSSIAESLKGSKCDVVKSFNRVYIVFNDILQTKSASEDTSVVPLSMFSREQWDSMVNTITVENYTQFINMSDRTGRIIDAKGIVCIGITFEGLKSLVEKFIPKNFNEVKLVISLFENIISDGRFEHVLMNILFGLVIYPERLFREYWVSDTFNLLNSNASASEVSELNNVLMEFAQNTGVIINSNYHFYFDSPYRNLRVGKNISYGSEEYPKPLSMFSEEEWNGLGKTDRVNINNWDTVLPNSVFLYDGYGLIKIRVTDISKLIDLVESGKDINNSNDIEFFKIVLNYAEKYHGYIEYIDVTIWESGKWEMGYMSIMFDDSEMLKMFLDSSEGKYSAVEKIGLRVLVELL